MVVFPGAAVAVLAVAYGVSRQRLFGRGARRPALALHRVRAVALGVAVFGVLGAYGASSPEAVWCLGLIVQVGLWIAIGVSVVLVIRSRVTTTAHFEGLAVAALVCFMLSLGPEVTIGDGTKLFDNLLYTFSYDQLFVLRAVRVVSRFSIIVLTFFVVVAAAGLQELASRRRRGSGFLVATAMALLLVEARTYPYEYREMPAPMSASISRALEAPELTQHTLMILPAGARHLDSLSMLAAVNTRHYLVNGWSGFEPVFYERLVNRFDHRGAGAGLALLWKLWPDPLVLVDKEGLRRERDVDGYATTEGAVSRRADLLADDDLHALYRPRPSLEPITIYERFARRDVTARLPVVRFTARAADLDRSIAVDVACNDWPVATLTVDGHWRTFSVDLTESALGQVGGDMITIGVRQPSRDTRWEIREFALVERSD